MRYTSFFCPTCERVCSMSFGAAWWCLHGDNFQAHPPYSPESDWTRMLPVVAIETGELPEGHDRWVVIESRNRFGYPGGTLPGDDKRGTRIVARDLNMADAYAFAANQPTDDVPSHIHSFRAYPSDIAWEEDA